MNKKGVAKIIINISLISFGVILVFIAGTFILDLIKEHTSLLDSQTGLAKSILSNSSKDKDGIPIRITEIVPKHAGGVDWCDSKDLIAFDSRTSEGKSDIYVIKSNGTDKQCITCEDEEFSDRNVGQPAWSPDCKYILFQVERENDGTLIGKLPEPALEPQFGIHNELWVMTSDGTQKWKLFSVEDGKGVLHPHFSHDGTKIAWSEITSFYDFDPYTWEFAKQKYEATGSINWITKKWAFQDWQIRTADFDDSSGKPELENVQTLSRIPDIKILHELGDFSPDDKKIVFMSNDKKDAYHWYGFNIYVYNLETKHAYKITDTALNWEGHPHYSKNKHILWSSGTKLTEYPTYAREMWIMDESGNNKKQLTHFNSKEYPEYIGENYVVMLGDSDWNNDGTSFVVFARRINMHTKKVVGKIYRIDILSDPL